MLQAAPTCMIPTTRWMYMPLCPPRFFHFLQADRLSTSLLQPSTVGTCYHSPSTAILLRLGYTVDILDSRLHNLQSAPEVTMTMVPHRGGGGGITLHVDGNRLGTCRTPGCERWPATNTDFCNNRTCGPPRMFTAVSWRAIVATDISVTQTAAQHRAARSRSSMPVTTRDTAILVSIIILTNDMHCIIITADSHCRRLLQVTLQRQKRRQPILRRS